jgi:uncharacterized protein
MLVVADSSALIGLAACQGLHFLLQLYKDIKVPEAVYVEVTQVQKPQAEELAAFLSGRTILVNTTQWVLAVGDLGRGKIEAMTLYKQLGADMLLIDDRRARLIAEHNGIHCIGALGILLKAKEQGVIAQIAPYIQALRKSPVYYAESLLDKVLEIAKE